MGQTMELPFTLTGKSEQRESKEQEGAQTPFGFFHLVSIRSIAVYHGFKQPLLKSKACC